MNSLSKDVAMVQLWSSRVPPGTEEMEVSGTDGLSLGEPRALSWNRPCVLSPVAEDAADLGVRLRASGLCSHLAALLLRREQIWHF